MKLSNQKIKNHCKFILILSFGKISKLLPLPKYFSSEWSFAQFRIPDLKSICTFGPENTLIVISSDGKYYQASFDPKNGGECTKMQETSLNINGII